MSNYLQPCPAISGYLWLSLGHPGIESEEIEEGMEIKESNEIEEIEESVGIKE